MLLRAYPEAGTSGAVVVEARLLAEHLPADASQQLLCEGSALGRIGVRESAQQHQLLYYQDSTSHSAQELARKAWKTLPAAAAAAAAVKRGITGAGGNNSSQKAAKKVKLPHGSSADAVAGAAGEGEEAMDATTTVPLPRKKSGANLASGSARFCFISLISISVSCIYAHRSAFLELFFQVRSRLVRRRRPIILPRVQTSDSCW